MEKQTHTNASLGSRGAAPRSVLYGIGVALVILAVIALAATWGGQRAVTAPVQSIDANAILIYSPTCSHCHALIQYLEEKNAFSKINILKTTDLSKYRGLLEGIGLQFNGVPTMIVRVGDETTIPKAIRKKINGPYIVIVGFPSEYQNRDGYFMGKEKELEYCRGIHGTPYYENNTYLFCIRPDGTIIGNEHAIDWLLRILASTQ